VIGSSARNFRSTDHPAGKGMTGTAFRTGKPCIMNDSDQHQQRQLAAAVDQNQLGHWPADPK